LPTFLAQYPAVDGWNVQAAGSYARHSFLSPVNPNRGGEMDVDSRDKISRRGKSVPPFWTHEKSAAIRPPSLIDKISENARSRRLQNS